LRSTSSVTTAGTVTVSSINTGSYRSAFYNYYVASSSNARAGQVMSVWNGTTIRYTEVTTTDVGTTSNVAFSVELSGTNVNLRVSSSGGWDVRSITNLL
jgi:hypothetical protein